MLPRREYFLIYILLWKVLSRTNLLQKKTIYPITYTLILFEMFPGKYNDRHYSKINRFFASPKTSHVNEKRNLKGEK